MRKVLAGLLLAALVPGCGDDDEEEGPSSAGWAWIDIDTPTSEGWMSTSAESVNLGGSAFIRSENGGPLADVSWLNLSTAQAGSATSTFSYDWVCFLWYCVWGEVGHRWSAAIPLAPGDNLIEVEARTNEFNWARKRVTVLRSP